MQLNEPPQLAPKDSRLHRLTQDFFPRQIAGWKGKSNLIACDICGRVVAKEVIQRCHTCGVLYDLKTHYCSGACLSLHVKEKHMIGGQLKPEVRGLLNIPKHREEPFLREYRKRMQDAYGTVTGIPEKDIKESY